MIKNRFCVALSMFFALEVTSVAFAQGWDALPELGYPGDHEVPIDRYIRPDFRIQQIQVRRDNANGDGRWVIRVSVDNIGGNRGLRGVKDYIPIRFDILECLSGGPDSGSPNFVCRNPRVRSFQKSVPAPLAQEATYGGIVLRLRFPHDVYVMINEPGDGTLGSYSEQGYPHLGNNRALLKILWDSRRSSCSPCPWVWTWPNAEDTLPY